MLGPYGMVGIQARGALPLNPRHPHGLWPWGLMRAYAMRQLSKVTYRRHQWKHKAKQRADRERYQRKQTARISAERDRTTQALKAAQARLQQLEAQLRQLEAQLQRQAAPPKVEGVLVSLHLFLVARIGL